MLIKAKMLLILTHAHSKWMDMHIANSATSATLGLPEIVVIDNGPTFTSAECAQFMQRNGIQNVITAPYHPVSNGLAECAVQTVKEGLQKLV